MWTLYKTWYRSSNVQLASASRVSAKAAHLQPLARLRSSTGAMAERICTPFSCALSQLVDAAVVLPPPLLVTQHLVALQDGSELPAGRGLLRGVVHVVGVPLLRLAPECRLTHDSTAGEVWVPLTGSKGPALQCGRDLSASSIA